jgi:uncharacterized coiled-coil protein SlyX
MIPRAGRRASVVPQASAAIDPLEPPPVASSGPSWLDDDNSAPPPSDLAATTMGTPPPASTFAPPSSAVASWLDDDAPSRAMTPRAITPAVVTSVIQQPHQSQAAVGHSITSAPVPPLHPADLSRARSVSPQSDLGSQQVLLSTGYAAHSTTPPTSSIAIGSQIIRGGAAPQQQQQQHFVASSSSPLVHQSIVAPSPANSHVDTLRSPPLSGHHPLSIASTATPPPASVVVVFDDHASVRALLEQELEEVTRATDHVKAVIATIDDGTHPLVSEIQQADHQAASAEAQLRHCIDAIHLMHSGFADRRAALEMRGKAAKETIAATLAMQTAQDSEQRIRALEVVIQAQSDTISTLRDAVADAVHSITDDTQASNQAAILELSSKIVGLFREDRSALKIRSKGVLEEEARVVIAEAAAERAAMLELDRSARVTAVRDHRELRTRRFETFRGRAKDDRQLSADRLFGSLRLRMERFAGEAQARSKASLETFRSRIAEEDVRTHREANTHVEHLLKRQHDDAVTFERTCERSVNELHQRLAALGNHERRMHDAALESANRLLNETVRNTTSDPSYDTHSLLSTLRDAEGISVNHSSLEHLHGIVASLTEGVNEASHAAAASVRRAAESEVAKLIVERETVLHELGRETASQKLRLDQDWKRLETGLLDLGAKADAFEKCTRQGRVMLTAAQSRLEQVRATWEQEGRRALHSTIGSGGADGAGLLQDHPTTTVMFEIGCSLTTLLDHHRRLKKQRFVEAQGVDAVDRDLMHRREECASATMNILKLFESLGELSAKVELKQATVASEAADVEAARDEVRGMRSAFESGVAIAKDVADRLRHVSAVVDEQQRKMDQQLYQRGYGWRNNYSPHNVAGNSRDLQMIPPSHQNVPLQGKQVSSTYAGGGAMRHTSSDSSSTSESKYRHLYQQHSRSTTASHHQPLRQNQTAGGTPEDDSRNYSAAFQSLIPLDPMESFDNDDRAAGHYREGVARARDTSAGTTHEDGDFSLRSNRASGGAGGERPVNGVMVPGPSESGSEHHRGTGRSSLPTPSSDSGPPR